MKKSLLSINSTISVLILAASLLVGCDGMNSINQKYYDRGETIYTGIVDSINVYPGYGKVAFDWQINADPRIIKVVMFWNMRQDSLVVPVNRTVYKIDTMACTIESIPEGNYIFEFITRDDEGHHSITKEATVIVYGEEYCKTLRNRSLSSISRNAEGGTVLSWIDSPSSDILYSLVRYKVNGTEKIDTVYNSESKTILTGPSTGDEISISSVYLLKGALEPLTATPRYYTVPRYSTVLDKSRFSILLLPGDNNTDSRGRTFAKTWDGSTTSILHTIDNAPGFSFPHHFSFDIGTEAEIHSFTLWPRGDVAPFTGHSPSSYELWATKDLHDVKDTDYYVSDSWKSDWVQLVDYTASKPATTEAQKSEWAAGWQSPVNHDGERFRYFRLVVKSNWQGSNCINIGEISLKGDDL